MQKKATETLRRYDLPVVTSKALYSKISETQLEACEAQNTTQVGVKTVPSSGERAAGQVSSSGFLTVGLGSFGRKHSLFLSSLGHAKRSMCHVCLLLTAKNLGSSPKLGLRTLFLHLKSKSYKSLGMQSISCS